MIIQNEKKGLWRKEIQFILVILYHEFILSDVAPKGIRVNCIWQVLLFHNKINGGSNSFDIVLEHA